MALAGRRQRDLQVGEERERVRHGVARDHHRHHVGERRPGVSALRERAPAAEQQETAAAHVHEVGEHRKLVVREEARFHIAEDDRAIAEQLGPRLREARHEIVGAVYVQAVELVLRGPLERDDLQVRVGFDGGTDELHLGARRALEVQHAFAVVAHVDERLLRVVLRDLLARLRRNSEGERPRAGVVRRDAYSHGRNVAVGRQRDRIARYDAPAVLDDQRDLLPRVAALPDHDVGDQRPSAKHRRRRLDPLDLDVLVEPVRAEPDGEYRNRLRAKRQQLVAHRGAGVVGAVAHDDETRQRNRVQLLACLLDGVGDVRLAGVERERGRAVDSLSAGRKAEHPDLEFLPQRRKQRAIGAAERVLGPCAARLPVAVGDAHAARVVDQDPDVVALRNGRREEQHRPHQAGQQHDEGRHPKRAQDPPIAARTLGPHACVTQNGGHADGGRREEQQQHRKRDAQRQIAVGELARPVLEQEVEDGFEQWTK